MKKLLFFLCSCIAVSAFADITIFPGSKINSMAGFQSWQCGADAITAVQSRGYSWSAMVPVEFNAAKVSAFNVVLSASEDINGKLTIYFRRKGEKTFDKASFCRKNFTARANEPLTVTIPMKNGNWNGDITGFRFDISGKKGVKWTISKIYFTAEEAASPVAAEIGIFPEMMLYPMVGFDKWLCGKDAITTVQTRPYSWSAMVPVEFNAAKVSAFNVVLSAGEDINGKLTIYFRRKGEKNFDKASFCRKNFTAKANEPLLVTIPLKNGNWKDIISGFRFDISGKKGLAWKISRIYFTGSSDALLSSGAKPKTAVKAKKTSVPAENLSSDIVIFPGKKKLEPQVGFKTFQCGTQEIIAEQSRDYSYTAPIFVNLKKAEGCKFLNCTLESDKNISGNVGIYFARKGEKSFRDTNRKRITFTLEANKAQTISIPLSGGNWKGAIDRIRFDISGKADQKWIIRKIWFSKKQPGAFQNNAFNAPVKLTSGSVKLIEKRYDLLEGREYRFAFNSTGVKTSAINVKFYNDVDKSVGGVGTTAHHDGNNDKVFAITPGTTYTVIEVTASGDADGELRDFQFGETGRRTGANWQASWICHPQGRRTADPAVFTYTREIELPELPLDGRIQLTADDGYILKVNGIPVARRDGGWQQTALHEITKQLKAGKNLIEISVMNANGPTALIAELRFDMPDGKIILIKTDKSFKVKQIEGKGTLLGEAAAMELGIPPIAPWHSVAYNALAQRIPVKIAKNSLKYVDGKITGELTIEKFPPVGLPMLLSFDGGVAGKFKHAHLNNTLKLSYDVSALLPGKYTLSTDPEFIVNAGKLLNFTVPPQKNVKNIVVKPVQKDGYLQMMLDGKPLWFSGFRARRESQRDRAYRDGNYRIMYFGAGMGGSDGSNSGRTWLGPERCEFEKVEESLGKFIRTYPEAKILVTYGIDGPRWWCQAHPEECVWFENGKKPEGLTSLASRKWRKEGVAAFRAFLKYFEKSKYAPWIIGYRIQAHCSGGEFQYLGTWQRKYADYSPAMQSYFREFLTKRYGSDAKLQKAWNNSAVTLKTAKIPTGKERKAAELGMFRDLDKARNVADFIDCLSDAMVSGAMEFLQVLREEAPNKLAGLYGGYVYYYSGYQLLNSAHANFGKLYRSRLADFISSPHDYIQRKVGWPGGHHGPVVGTSLYNLSWWDENDTRTIMCAPGGHRHVDSMHETIGVLKRDLILQITKGVGNTFYDLAGGWFDHPAIMEALRKTNQIGKFALTVPGFKRGQAAVLYCAESIKRLAENNNGITVPLRQDMRRNLGWSGITVDQYLLEDILQDNFPEYDCYILPNAYAPGDKVRKAINEKLLKKGKLVIFGYAPGAFRENSGKIDLAAMKELTGIGFGCADGKITRMVNSKFGKLGNAVKFSPAFFVKDKKAQVMGTFVNSKLGAIAAKKVNGANVVVTMVPELNAAMYRDIFRKNGMHIFCESEDPIYYDGRFIAIHANTSGEKVLTLPEAREWYDLFRNKAVSGKSKTLKLKMERGQTEIFFIGSKADAERYQKMEQ